MLRDALKRYVPALLPFLLLDLTLRAATTCSDWHPIYALTPGLFSLGFGALFLCVSMIPMKRSLSRVIYGAIYAFWAVYAIVQYGVWRIFGRFLFLSDLSYAGEGLDFIGYIKELLDIKFILVVVLLVIFGAAGVRSVPKIASRRKAFPVLLGFFFCVQVVTPYLYGPVPELTDWDTFKYKGYEYREFTSSVYDMALTGPYQFVAHDAALSARPDTDFESKIETIEAFFSERPEHRQNEMTAALKGKNLIMVQLESVDDFIVNETNTPAIAGLMKESINFTEFYTPQYTAGYTFNTEFAAQTGMYPYANGNVAYTLGRSRFPYTIASLLSKEGYTSNSFHKGSAQFYNRGAMHQAFGFQKYNSFLDYTDDEFAAEDDRFLLSDPVYEKLTESEPFCNFVITYSAHLGYDEKDAMTTKALQEFPQYNDPTRPYEINGLIAKARITDEMLGRLFQRLQSDGLLENTVVCVYTDHYAYGLSDRDMLTRYSDNAGGRLPERTPCFIWYKGCTPMTVDKTLQTVDLLPTLANLFGLEPPKTMGRDAFDPDYEGCVIFQHPASWMNSKAYVENGEVQWNNGMSDGEIAAMNSYARRFQQVNDAMLDVNQ